MQFHAKNTTPYKNMHILPYLILQMHRNTTSLQPHLLSADGLPSWDFSSSSIYFVNPKVLDLPR